MPPKHYTGLRNPSILREKELKPSTIETIDAAMLDWVEGLNLHSTTNKGWVRTPVLWVSAERAFQTKHNRDLRDINNILKLPLLTIERTAMAKDPGKKGIYWGNVPPVKDGKGGSITIGRRIKQEVTARHTNAHTGKKTRGGVGHGQVNFRTRKISKPIFESITIPMPVYVDVSYSIVLQCEYQQQINELITPFMTRVGPEPGAALNYFLMTRDGHVYEAFIQQDYSQENNSANMDEESRVYKTTIEIKVLGYLLGGGPNEEKPMIVYRESAVTVSTPRERSILGDRNDNLVPDSQRVTRGFYRDDPSTRVMAAADTFPGDLPPEETAAGSSAGGRVGRGASRDSSVTRIRARTIIDENRDGVEDSRPDPQLTPEPFESC
mgnify:CR=1 FL=1